MRRLILFAFLIALALPARVRAQLSVQLTMERDTFLLYESIPIVVNIRNYSGRPIELTDPTDACWLNFTINDEAGASLTAVGNRLALDPVKIPPGLTVSVSINLLPHYDLRQRGTYTVRGVVDGGGARGISAPIRFTLINGREIWKQTVGLPVDAGETNEEYRTYALVSRRSGRSDELYISVQDDEQALVYGMLRLGEMLSLGEPRAKVDGAAHLHVLYRSGPHSYSYAEVDPVAKMSKRAVYSDMLSVPQLVANEDGSISVLGGEQTYPRRERVMTDEELNPPPPPAPAPPKKKWWWPFGPAKAAPGATNAPSANFGTRG